jgi:SAM-dependent methyltransferase
MNGSDAEPHMDAATAYEEFLVPALFRQWAARVVDAAQLQPAQRVLDVACGTGILAREAMSRVAPDGSVSGVDPDPGMLSVAERHAPDINWHRGVAECLPFADQSFDAVVSQFGFMFFADRPKAVSEILRVLMPGGRLAVAVWDSLDNIPGYAAEVELVRRIAGDAAANALRAPFVLGDTRELAELFRTAGVADATVTTFPGEALFPSARFMVELDVRGWLPLVGVPLEEDQISRIVEEAEQALSPFVTTGNGIRCVMSAHIVTGTKPLPSMPTARS